MPLGLAIGAGAGCLVGLVWIAYLLRFHAAGRAFPELHSGSYPGPPQEPRRISLVVAAHDEEAEIEACVRSLLAQDYPDLELVVVDDRSSDGTPRILERLRAELAGRLQVLTIEQLPEGWGGQNHALQRGVEASSGEWLCFTDADCRFDSERTLSLAWEEARRNGVELLSILPRMEAPTLWEKAYLPLCSFVLLVQLQIVEVNDPLRPAGYANGAFILIRRAAYERLGGHERVRHFVNDDVVLSRLAKAEGVPQRVAANLDLCRTRMYGAIGDAWRGWSRNFYGTLQESRRIGGALALTLGLFILPWLGLAASLAVALTVEPRADTVALAWAFPVAVSHLGLWRLFGACGFRSAWSLLYPLGAVFVAGVLANAFQRAWRETGTTWHGVHYVHPSKVDLS